MSWLSDIFSPAVPPPAPDPVQPPAPAYDVDAEFEKLAAQREGRKNVVYKDSLGKLTTGIGHLVLASDHLVLGQTISDAQVDMFWKADSAAAMAAARHQAEQAGITDPKFLPYLASVCFQLGTGWINKFPNTWKMICKGEYETAAVALGGTLWAKQTPVRVADFQGALRRLPAKP